MPQIQESPRFEVRRSKISLGPEGGRWSIQKTAELAQRAATDPYVRAWTVQKLHEAAQRGVPVETPEQKASVLLEAVQREFTYVPDPVYTEMMVAPKWMVQGFIPGGDCDDLTALTAAAFLAALSSAGIRSAVLGQAYDKSKKIQHVLCAVYLGNKWVYADPSSKLPLGKSPAPHTWELVYDPLMPEKPFCDATSCLVGQNSVPPPRYTKTEGDFVGVAGLPVENPWIEFKIVDPAEDAIVSIEEIPSVLEESNHRPNEEFCYTPEFPFRRPCKEIAKVPRSSVELARAAMPYPVPGLGNWPLDLPPVAPQPYMIAMPEAVRLSIGRPLLDCKEGDCTTCSGSCASCRGNLLTSPFDELGVISKPEAARLSIGRPLLDCKEGDCTTCSGSCASCCGNLLTSPFEDPGWSMRPMKYPLLFVEETSQKILENAWAVQIANLRASLLESMQMLVLAYEHLSDLCKKFGVSFPPVLAGQFGPAEQKIISDAVKFSETAIVVMDQALANEREVVFTEQNGEPELAFKTLATDNFRYIAGKAISTIGLEAFLPQLIQLDTTVGTGLLPLALPFVAGVSVSMTIAMIKNTQGTLDFMRNIVDKVSLWLINREARKMLEAGASPKDVQGIQGNVYAGELRIKEKEIERMRTDLARLENENKNLQSLINKGIFVGSVALVTGIAIWAWKNFGGYVPTRPPSSPSLPPPGQAQMLANMPLREDTNVDTYPTPTMVSPR